MNKKEALRLVKKDGFELENLPAHFKKDKEIVLVAVKHSQYGHPLEYADEKLRKDKKFISELVRLNPSVIVYIHDSLTKDKKFLLDLLKIDSFFLLFHVEIDKRFNYLLKDKEFMLKIIKHNIDALGYADNTLRKDKNFLLEVLKQNRDAIMHFDNSLVADKKFVLSAVKQGSDILPYCTQACYENEEINLAAQKITKKEIATLSKKKTDNKVNKYGMTELEGAKEEMFKLKYFLSEIKKKKN
jgi:hypothetical protein